MFTPANLNITVGDTVRWFWINGDHTTTSLTVPAGALSWDAQINITRPVFNYPVTIAGNYTYKCTPHFPDMQGTITANPFGIIKISNEVPQSFSLSQNYPNPFNPMTKFKFQMPKDAFVKISVFDVLGREVATLVNEQLNPGTYETDFDGSNFASGVYYYKIITDDLIQTRKMVLVK